MEAVSFEASRFCYVVFAVVLIGYSYLFVFKHDKMSLNVAFVIIFQDVKFVVMKYLLSFIYDFSPFLCKLPNKGGLIGHAV